MEEEKTNKMLKFISVYKTLTSDQRRGNDKALDVNMLQCS